MSELSIKVSIAGRTYPLTIKRSEEEVIRKAAKKVDDAVNVFRDNYAVKDKQDLLAMAALQMATQALKGAPEEDQSEILKELQSIQDILNS